jgi:uncharacterized protein YqgV (UPF0045/DUF77 family)
VIKEKNLKYKVTPTSTVLEGDIDDLWEAAKEMQQKSTPSGSGTNRYQYYIHHRTD